LLPIKADSVRRYFSNLQTVSGKDISKHSNVYRLLEDFRGCKGERLHDSACWLPGRHVLYQRRRSGAVYLEYHNVCGTLLALLGQGNEADDRDCTT
jgi:hypothetical protein